ncbi:MAG: hypothetical protein AAGI53_10580 [Planctomycetota bacterium]
MKIAILAVAGLAAAAAAQTSPNGGNVVAWWDTFGNDGNSPSLPTTGTVSNLSAADWTRSADINPSSAGNTFAANGWNDGDETTNYFSTTLTVDAGYQLDLADLVIGIRRSGSGPTSINLRSSLDGFSSSLFTFDGSDDGFQNDIIDLSSLGPITGSVEFRITGAGASSANGTLRIGDYSEFPTFFDLQFQGDVSLVPTPGAMAAFGLAGLAAARRRR